MHCCDVLCVISSDKGWRLESKTNFWGFQISVLWWLCPNSFSFLFPSQKHNGVGLGVLFWHCQARAQYAALDAWVPVKARSYRFLTTKTPGILHTLCFLFEKWVVSEGLWADWSSKPRLPGEQKCIVKSVCEAFGLSTFEASDSQELGRENLLCLRCFMCSGIFQSFLKDSFWKCGIKQISTCTIRGESQVTTLHVDDLVFSWRHGGRTEPRWHTEFYTQLLERDKVL